MSAKIDAAPLYTFNLPSQVSAPDTERGSSFLKDLQTPVRQQSADTSWGKADIHDVPRLLTSLDQKRTQQQENIAGKFSTTSRHTEDAPAAILYPFKLTAVGHLSYADAVHLSETASIALTENRLIKAAQVNAVYNPVTALKTGDSQQCHTSNSALQDRPECLEKPHLVADESGLDPINNMASDRAAQIWDKTKTSLVMSSDGLQVFIRDYAFDVNKKPQLIHDVLSQMVASKQVLGKIWLNGHLIWQSEYKS